MNPLIFFFCLFCLFKTSFAYFKSISEVPAWMDRLNQRETHWKGGEAMLHEWYTHDPWHILDEISMDAKEGLCLDTLDMVLHRKNFGIEQRQYWVFVPIDNKMYAAPFGNSDRCIFSGSDSAQAILAKIGPATKYAPLSGWVLKERDIVGLAISNSSKTECTSPRCRSNIVWSRLRVTKRSEGKPREFEWERVGVVDRWSSGSIFEERPHVRGIPSMQDVIGEMWERYPEALEIAKVAIKNKDSSDAEEKYEFHDRAIQKLHVADPNFGHYASLDGEDGGPALKGDAGYWLGAGAPVGEPTNEHNEVHYVKFLKYGERIWFTNKKYSIYAHKWRIPRKWVYPRPGAPNYGYDLNHPGPMPLSQQKLIDKLQKLDRDQAEQFEEIHDDMIRNVESVHKNCATESNLVTEAEQRKMQLIVDSHGEQMNLLSSIHRERMGFFQKPRELTDSLERLFSETQRRLKTGIEQLHRDLSRDLQNAYESCVSSNSFNVSLVRDAEERKGRSIRDANTEKVDLLDNFHQQRMDIVKKF